MLASWRGGRDFFPEKSARTELNPSDGEFGNFGRLGVLITVESKCPAYEDIDSREVSDASES